MEFHAGQQTTVDPRVFLARVSFSWDESEKRDSTLNGQCLPRVEGDHVKNPLKALVSFLKIHMRTWDWL